MKTIKLAFGLFIFAAVLFTVTSFTAVNVNQDDEQINNETIKVKHAIRKDQWFIPTNG